MQFDWITVLAQLVNFLMLVWLLNRFLFRPVLAVMASRENLIDEQLQEASLQIRQADSVRQKYQTEINALEAEKDAILSAAVTQAEADERKLMDNAREKINKRRNTWLDSLEIEKQELANVFKQSIATTVSTISENLLRRISNRGLNDQMVDSFIDQLNTLDSSTKDRIRANQQIITIVSAEPVNSRSRRILTKALQEQFDYEQDINYQIDQQLIAGLRLHVDGFGLDWNLSNMLESLEDELAFVIENADANAH